MADMTTLIVISSFIMFPAVMMAQEVVNHGVCPVPVNKEEEEIIKEQERNREEMEEIMREIEISCLDECKAGLHNCHDDAYCTNTKRSFTCTCKPGYTGDGVNCADINECKTGEHLCDTDISECENAKGYYKCVCKSGYESKCTDKCKRGQHNCHDDAYCTSTKRSFTCTCKQGFTGDGVNCAAESILQRSFKNEEGYYLIEGAGHTVTGTKSLSQCNTKGVFLVGKIGGKNFIKSPTGWYLAIDSSGNVYMKKNRDSDTDIKTKLLNFQRVALYRKINSPTHRYFLSISPQSGTISEQTLASTKAAKFRVRYGSGC